MSMDMFPDDWWERLVDDATNDGRRPKGHPTFIHPDDGYVCVPCNCGDPGYHCVCGIREDGTWTV